MVRSPTAPRTALPRDDVRRRNLGGLLRQVHLAGPLARTALAQRLGLNRSTIMALTAELAAAGLVAEAPVRARIAANVLPVARERVRLRVSALGDDATLIGAAELAFSGLLADPLDTLARVAA
jgi:hypothetical protein